MSALVILGVLVIVMALIVAAAAKVVNREASEESLIAIGASPGLAGRMAPLVPLIETSVAAGLAVAPGSAFAQGSTCALFLLFALAGVRALWQDGAVKCACFGSISSRSELGWRQVGQLFPVGLVVAALASGEVHWGPQQGLAVFGCCIGTAGFISLWLALPSWLQVRADRISLMDTRIATKRNAASVDV